MSGKHVNQELGCRASSRNRHAASHSLYRGCGAGLSPCSSDAKIPSFSWHCLRHTFTSRLVVVGVDIRTVQALLGHKTIAMTVRYSHCHFCQFCAPALPR
jgi:site-specific recombinase XerD